MSEPFDLVKHRKIKGTNSKVDSESKVGKHILSQAA